MSSDDARGLSTTLSRPLGFIAAKNLTKQREDVARVCVTSRLLYTNYQIHVMEGEQGRKETPRVKLDDCKILSPKQSQPEDDAWREKRCRVLYHSPRRTKPLPESKSILGIMYHKIGGQERVSTR